MHKYRLVAKKGEGTFSEVLKAQSVVTGEYFAIKCMKNHFKSIEQVNSLREIQALRRLNPHENIIPLEEVLFDEQSGRLALVFELMDMNIYELIRGRKQYLKPTLVKSLMYQLMKAVAHMHKNGIFHRDIKPENILVHNEELKIADLGSCRGMYTKQPFTEYISTRWYRAPECLLTNGYYDYNMDLWGVGCVMFEIVSLFPLFPGTNELDQIDKVHSILGTPSPEVLELFKKHTSHISSFNFPPKEGTGIARLIPHADPHCIDLIESLVAYNPEDRISAKQALKHAYFREMHGQYDSDMSKTKSKDKGRVRTVSPEHIPPAPSDEMASKKRGNKKEKKLPQVGGGSTTNQQTNQGGGINQKKMRTGGGKGKSGKTHLSIGSSDDDEDMDVDDNGENSFGEEDKKANLVAKELSLPPSIVKQKNRKQKIKKNYNSSATNLPTILPAPFGNVGGNGQQAQLSLNITGYKPKTKYQNNQYRTQANDRRSSTKNANAAKKKIFPPGNQVASMSYQKNKKQGYK